MKPIYSNNRSAPRMRKGEFSKMVVTRELHKKFQKEFPEYKDMPWEEFFSKWLDIADKVRHHAVNNPLGVKMGSYLGEIKVQYIPYQMEIVNNKKSQEAGEQIFEHNFDSKGKPARVKWERRWAAKFNKSLQFYAFDETRELTKAANEYIVNHPAAIRVARVTTGGWRIKTKKK